MAQPAVFTVNQLGTGQGVIVDPNFQIAGPGNAVAAGTQITVFCAGLGEVDPPVATGAVAPSSPRANTVNLVTLTIGGIEASVQFSGLAPGFAGLYQVDATVPEGVQPGDNVPVVLTVAGQTSPPVTMSVQ